MDTKQITEVIRDVLNWESQCLRLAAERLTESIAKPISLLKDCSGRIVVTGMGKMGHVARKAAATFSSTGSPAFFLHPSEALHGDLGMVAKTDVMIAISNSGETEEILALLPHVLRQGIPLIAMTGRITSTLAKRAQEVVDIGVPREADEISLAPTASTTVAMAVCDAMAISLMRARGFTRDQFAIFHPSGHLGKKMLTLVRDVMHGGDRIPLAPLNCPLRDAIVTMSQKGLGCVFAVDDVGRLMGIFTDGDLRRSLADHQNPLSQKLDEHMVKNPKIIKPEMLAAEALQIMEKFSITVLPVVDPDLKPIGVLHLHALVQLGLA